MIRAPTHPGIATQMWSSVSLPRKTCPRHGFGSRKFAKKVWEWKEVSVRHDYPQMRRVGCSADWTREYFSHDGRRARRNRDRSVRACMSKGLIYRGKRLVNWDPVLGTAMFRFGSGKRGRTSSCGTSASAGGQSCRASYRGDHPPRRCWAFTAGAVNSEDRTLPHRLVKN